MRYIKRVTALVLSMIMILTMLISSNIMTVFALTSQMTIVNNKNTYPYWTSDYTFTDENGVSHTHNHISSHSGQPERVVQFKVAGQPYYSFCLQFWKDSANGTYTGTTSHSYWNNI